MLTDDVLNNEGLADILSDGAVVHIPIEDIDFLTK